MYFFQFLIVLGFVCLIQAKCRQPTPVGNFSHTNFVGSWNRVAFTMMQKADEIIYQLSSCPVLTLVERENGRSIWRLHTLIGALSEITLGGTYDVPDPNKGFLQENTLGLVSFYEYTVMCTDYVNYAATYACLEVAPGYTTEWISLDLRDPSKYDQVITMKELEKCYLELPIKSAKELVRRPFTNCKGKDSGLLGLVGGLVGGLANILSGLLKAILG